LGYNSETAAARWIHAGRRF